MNFFTFHFGIYSMFFWLLAIICIFYILTNYFSTFNDNLFKFTIKQNLVLTSILIFQLICVLPFFLILSCDLGRVFFYWVSTTFAVFLMFPTDIIEKSIPSTLKKAALIINSYLRALLLPSKSILTLMMVFIGIPTMFFSFEDVIGHSIFGNILWFLSKYLNYILFHI